MAKKRGQDDVSYMMTDDKDSRAVGEGSGYSFGENRAAQIVSKGGNEYGAWKRQMMYSRNYHLIDKYAKKRDASAKEYGHVLDNTSRAVTGADNLRTLYDEINRAVAIYEKPLRKKIAALETQREEMQHQLNSASAKLDDAKFMDGLARINPNEQNETMPNVLIKKKWGSHEFTPLELKQLAQGKPVTFRFTSKQGNLTETTGKLVQRKKRGVIYYTFTPDVDERGRKMFRNAVELTPDEKLKQTEEQLKQIRPDENPEVGKKQDNVEEIPHQEVKEAKIQVNQADEQLQKIEQELTDCQDKLDAVDKVAEQQRVGLMQHLLMLREAIKDPEALEKRSRRVSAKDVQEFIKNYTQKHPETSSKYLKEHDQRPADEKEQDKIDYDVASERLIFHNVWKEAVAAIPKFANGYQDGGNLLDKAALGPLYSPRQQLADVPVDQKESEYTLEGLREVQDNDDGSWQRIEHFLNLLGKDNDEITQLHQQANKHNFNQAYQEPFKAVNGSEQLFQRHHPEMDLNAARRRYQSLLDVELRQQLDMPQKMDFLNDNVLLARSLIKQSKYADMLTGFDPDTYMKMTKQQRKDWRRKQQAEISHRNASTKDQIKQETKQAFQQKDSQKARRGVNDSHVQDGATFLQQVRDSMKDIQAIQHDWMLDATKLGEAIDIRAAHGELWGQKFGRMVSGRAIAAAELISVHRRNKKNNADVKTLRSLVNSDKEPDRMADEDFYNKYVITKNFVNHHQGMYGSVDVKRTKNQKEIEQIKNSKKVQKFNQFVDEVRAASGKQSKQHPMVDAQANQTMVQEEEEQQDYTPQL